MSRLPSRQAQLELVPGSEVGGSRVRLKVSATSPGGSPPRATTTATSAPASSRWAWVWTGTARWAWPTSSTCAPTATR
ncbi:hypothetical protein P4233_08770 [Pseudomonas aeruginosa]|nr:hypothetical protein [Pseudomonas aeruginosa]